MRSLKYTKGEMQILLNNYPITTDEQILALLPGRTLDAIRRQANLLGIRKLKKKAREDHWKGWELQYLRENYSTGDMTEIRAKMPHRSKVSIQRAAQKMGVYRVRKRIYKEVNSRNYFTQIEIDIVKEHYLSMRTNEVAAMLPGRTVDSVYKIAKKLGIRKPHVKNPGTPNIQKPAAQRKPAKTSKVQKPLPPAKPKTKVIESAVKRERKEGELRGQQFMKNYKRPASFKEAAAGLSWIPEIKMAVKLNGRTKQEVIAKYSNPKLDKVA